MKLNEIADHPGASKARKRIGRGMGSGTGKTGGRGVKGQTSRSGVSINGFEGGQMPIYRRLPKRGFKNPFRKQYAVLNLDRLQAAIDAKKVDAGKALDSETLIQAGIVRRAADGVRLLGKGELSAKVNLTVAGASKSAIAAVEKAGGSVTVTALKKAAAPVLAGAKDAPAPTGD